MFGLTETLDDQILAISFFKPDAGNSFGVEDAEALLKLIKKYSKQKINGLVWRSKHPTLFCSGGDLKAHLELKDKKDGLAQSRTITKALETLKNWPIPKIALVDGDCFGGGLEVLSCFDHRVCSPNVLFGFWQRRIGLSFGWGGFERWEERVSPDVVKSLALSARVFGASEARRFGFVQEIVPSNKMGQAAWLRAASQFSANSANAIASLGEKSESSLFEKLWWGPAHLNALKKFSR